MAGFGGRTRTSGQGRPKGVRNKRTVETEARIARAAEAAAKALPEAFQGDAHALLMLVYKNEALDLGVRLDAAKAAIRYERPALASVDAKAAVDVNTTVSAPQVIDPRSLTVEQRTALREILVSARDEAAAVA
jgi:hypothetical protein